MKKFLASLAAAAMMFVSGTALAIDIGNDGSIEEEGIMYPPFEQNMNATYRTATILAHRALAESIGELHVSSQSTVEDFILSKDIIKTEVDKILQGSKVTKRYVADDGSIHVAVRLMAFGSKSSLANVLLEEKTEVEDFPPPKFTNMDSGKVDNNVQYSGLIINCGGMSLSTAILTAIKSASGEEIYAYKNITRQMAVERGMVSYADSMDSGVQRAGNNPLVINALFPSDECDVVVSDADADKILIANQTTHFLNNCMVVFVR